MLLLNLNNVIYLTCRWLNSDYRLAHTKKYMHRHFRGDPTTSGSLLNCAHVTFRTKFCTENLVDRYAVKEQKSSRRVGLDLTIPHTSMGALRNGIVMSGKEAVKIRWGWFWLSIMTPSACIVDVLNFCSFFLLSKIQQCNIKNFCAGHCWTNSWSSCSSELSMCGEQCKDPFTLKVSTSGELICWFSHQNTCHKSKASKWIGTSMSKSRLHIVRSQFH